MRFVFSFLKNGSVVFTVSFCLLFMKYDFLQLLVMVGLTVSAFLEIEKKSLCQYNNFWLLFAFTFIVGFYFYNKFQEKKHERKDMGFFSYMKM